MDRRESDLPREFAGLVRDAPDVRELTHAVAKSLPGLVCMTAPEALPGPLGPCRLRR